MTRRGMFVNGCRIYTPPTITATVRLSIRPGPSWARVAGGADPEAARVPADLVEEVGEADSRAAIHHPRSRRNLRRAQRSNSKLTRCDCRSSNCNRKFNCFEIRLMEVLLAAALAAWGEEKARGLQ